MNATQKARLRKFLAELRSGKYPQGKRRLECHGDVLAEIANEELPK